MRTFQITDKDYQALAERDEGHFWDIKGKDLSGKAIQKAVCAFGNADGGELLVGVKDKKEGETAASRWDGFSETEALNGLLQAVFSMTPSPQLSYELLTCGVGEGYLLRLAIEKSAEVLSASDGAVYVRHGAQSIKLTDAIRIQELAFSKGATSYEDTILADVGTERITEAAELKEFLQDYSPTTDSLDFVVNQNLVEYSSWAVRCAAALLFHPAPSAVVPKRCAVKITRYETREDDPERDHLADQTSLEGPLYSLIHQTVEAVTKLMSQVSVWTSDGMGTLDYPPEAIWEIIVNALIHRDYSISDDTQILVFNDRIEVRSPGRLPGYVNSENILDARYSRNPKIVRTLNRYKVAPNKDLGEGLNTAFQKMKEFGLKEPKIVEDGNYVIVTLPHTPLATPGDAIMIFLKTHDTITNRQAREITGIKSENLVKIEFYKLRDNDLLEQVPGLKGPKSAWRKKE